MTDDTGSVRRGGDLHAQLHPTAEQRAAAKANTPQPKRAKKSVAAGRALQQVRTRLRRRSLTMVTPTEHDAAIAAYVILTQNP